MLWQRLRDHAGLYLLLGDGYSVHPNRDDRIAAGQESTTVNTIVSEKLTQAIEILDELEVDAWMTFVRESADSGESVLEMIVGHDYVWPSAFILTRSGERIAIVGKYDDAALREDGLWTNVIAYVEGIREPLVSELTRIDPAKLALNYSLDDPKADGLSHGLQLRLREYLADTPLAERFVSAGDIIGALRTRKTPTEVARIKAAIATTNEMFEQAGRFIALGRTEREVAAVMHEEVARRGLGYAWSPAGCPIVNTGPESSVGHALPSELAIEPGHVVHIDFGIKQDGFCSDIQRCWYVPRPGESSPPEKVCRAFDTVAAAIQAAFAVVRPGVECWQVDAAARKVVTEAGYPEYQHATGHHVGRVAHDGGGVLGPRWERYGRMPYARIEPGNVFTLELGVEDTGGAGYIGLEEMVLMTDTGGEWLTEPQTELELIGSG